LNYESNAGKSAHRTLGTHEQQSIWEIPAYCVNVSLPGCFLEEEQKSIVPRDAIGASKAIWYRKLAVFILLVSLSPPAHASGQDDQALAEKKLSPEWVKSLTERGFPTVYSSQKALDHIGMPIGGLCAGELYLGGDGRLWKWDIFNSLQKQGDIYMKRGALDPETHDKPTNPKQGYPVDQGFEIRLTDGDKSVVRTLDARGFPNITFSGEYPCGFVKYRDPSVAVEVSLEAFSPFIPLNVDDSSLPATVMKFTVKNTGSEVEKIELRGWLQNAVLNSVSQDDSMRITNRLMQDSHALILESSAISAGDAKGGSGHIDAGPITLTDHRESLKDKPDYGTMALGLLGPREGDAGIPSLASTPEESLFGQVGPAEKPLGNKLVGALSRKLSLKPGETQTITFVIAWDFPNLNIKGIRTPQGQYYANRFRSAAEVVEYIAENSERLFGQTQLWHDTFYNDSTLPHWLLERTVGNVSVLASSTVHRFSDGRFYGYEGVVSCDGACSHVWQYEQAMGRLFPQLDILLRERAEFNPKIAFHPDTGVIEHREEYGQGLAIDGQAGTILRAYRDCEMSSDNAFLTRNWSSIKMAIQCLINQPGGRDGMLRGAQHNTLDAKWYGPVSWLNGLYLASLRAGEEMAKVMGDDAFAQECRTIADEGSKSMVSELFNGEYFINKPDPAHPGVNSGSGCEIDQVMGQSWAFQVGLGRVLPEKETRSALQAIWHYNFIPDAGPWREANMSFVSPTKGFAQNWFAEPGEAGLLLCTFPKPDWTLEKVFDMDRTDRTFYFNQFFTGFEYEVAGHMIWEGMVDQGLAIVREIRDCYDANKRNPWNEIECGSHYARSMASYGPFIAICGYEYNGPKGYLAFAPRLSAEHFQAAFTAAEGWGSFSQELKNQTLQATVDVRFGRLKIQTLGLGVLPGITANRVQALLGGQSVKATLTCEANQYRVNFDSPLTIQNGRKLSVILE
jgi:uncharacterized protein (DUF608 family)